MAQLVRPRGEILDAKRDCLFVAIPAQRAAPRLSCSWGEATSKSSEAAPRRSQATPEKREAVPFVLTHDAIVKLVNDIVGNN